MTTTEIRAKLLAASKSMCEYVERELQDYPSFRYEYERGFIYGYSTYNISFSYGKNSCGTKQAVIAVNFYYRNEYYFANGKAYNRDNKDVTNAFLDGDGYLHEMSQAMEITIKRWNTIKEKIAEHKNQYNDIMNFKV